MASRKVVEDMALTLSLSDVQGELAKVDRETAVLDKRREALRKIAEGLHELNGHAEELFSGAAEESLHDGPRGRKAVLAVVNEQPGIWKLRDLADLIVDKGWATSRKPVEVAVHRLVTDGKARRVRTGVYEFPAVEKGSAP
jgi:hypothetical protein